MFTRGGAAGNDRAPVSCQRLCFWLSAEVDERLSSSFTRQLSIILQSTNDCLLHLSTGGDVPTADPRLVVGLQA